MGTMRAAIAITAFLAVASARTFSKKALSTPLARGGGRIVGGTDAYPGEFPHQIMLTRGVGGSLMCGGVFRRVRRWPARGLRQLEHQQRHLHAHSRGLNQHGIQRWNNWPAR